MILKNLQILSLTILLQRNGSTDARWTVAGLNYNMTIFRSLWSINSGSKELTENDKTFYSQIWGRWFGKTEMGAGMEQRARDHSGP